MIVIRRLPLGVRLGHNPTLTMALSGRAIQFNSMLTQSSGTSWEDSHPGKGVHGYVFLTLQTPFAIIGHSVPTGVSDSNFFEMHLRPCHQKRGTNWAPTRLPTPVPAPLLLVLRVGFERAYPPTLDVMVGAAFFVLICRRTGSRKGSYICTSDRTRTRGSVMHSCA